MASKSPNLGSIFDGLLGADTSDEDAQRLADRKKALDTVTGLKPPGQSTLTLGRRQWQGDLQPQATVREHGISAAPQTGFSNVAGVDAGPTAFGGVAADPRLKAEQDHSIAALDDLAAHGGLNGKDRANLTGIENESAQADRGRRDAIKTNMAARGMGGGGMELLQELASNQAATDRTSAQGLTVAGDAQARALDAIQRSGQLAGQQRGQDFSEKAQVAAAKDAVSRFNAQNSNETVRFNSLGQRETATGNAERTMRGNEYNANDAANTDRSNVGAANNAAETSWRGRQGVADSNTATGNEENYWNQVSAPQQAFGNQAQTAGMQANAYNGAANQWGQDAARKSAKQAAAIQGGLQIGGAVLGGFAGGPMGAAAGSKMGGEVGQGLGNMSQSGDRANRQKNPDEEDDSYVA